MRELTDSEKTTIVVTYKIWCEAHPEVAYTQANSRRFAEYLRTNNLPCTIRNLDAAYAAIGGQLEIIKTPAELEQERIERARKIIYEDVASKIAPAKIDFTNPSVLHKIATWLHANEKGLMSTDRLLRCIEALKFEPGIWQVEPADLYKSQEYVHGRLNHSKTDAKPTEEESNHPLGRRNHALDDVIDRESKERVKKLKKGIEDEEGRRIGAVVEHAISGYRAQKFNRIDNVQTEIIQGLLRKYSAKYGTGVIAAIRDLPDDPNAAEMWLRRRI